MAVRLALIRDWRKRVVCEAEAEQDEHWKADLAPDQQQFWEPEWQATPALPALTRPKSLSGGGGSSHWNKDKITGYAKEPVVELGTGQTTGDLGEAPGAFAPPGDTEPQAAPPDG